MPRYRMTPGRRAALKKAQIASARVRRGKGKGKSRSSASVATRKRRLKTAKRVAVAAAAVGAAAGAGYVYKNREKMVVAPAAERIAVWKAGRAARKRGVKLTKTQKHRVRMQERKDHAQRSTYRGREYLQARRLYRSKAPLGYTLKPGKSNSVWNGMGIDPYMQRQVYSSYRKDVNTRARHRLNRIKGRKTQGFSYNSGKVRAVIGGRVVKMPF